jgi:hypothetical protein
MLSASLIFLAVSASAVSWDSRNSPRIFSDSYEYNLKKLPSSGSVNQVAWSDTYWPSHRSGIANRWQSYDSQDFKYHLYSLAELKTNVTAEQLKQLSPAEKFDIFNARYDYPLVKEEWGRTSPSDAGWEGICHGWSPAAIHFAQPNPITLVNKDGIAVPFGSSDIKALLSFYEAQYDSSARVRFLAGRCNYDIMANPQYQNLPECKDVDAGAFHILVANQLGLLKEGFVADIDRSYMVWNQPINSYTSTISTLSNPRVNATAGTNSSVSVNTQITYSAESMAEWESHGPVQSFRSYSYELDLDSNGNIIGGDYDGYQRFDFIWSKDTSPFFGYFSSLGKIYSQSVNASTALLDYYLNEMAIPEDHLHADTHFNLIESDGSFSLNGYSNNDHRSWSIGNTDSSEGQIIITFSDFSTEKYRDQVYVYEGINGKGALIAVLHGDFSSKTVVVQRTGALVVFKSDQQVTKTGFKAQYSISSSL